MELFRALAAFTEPPGPEQARLAGVLGLPGAPDPAEFTELFDLQLYPYASVYLGPEGMLGGEARDRVAGFWRALGRTPPPEPDHLAALLALYATLRDGEDAEADPARRALRRSARRALLSEHLASWLPPYLDKLADLAPPHYRAWGAMLREALLGELASGGAPAALPLHLREAPLLPDPRDAGAGAFLAGLLAPVRSGVLLVRADLARAAQRTHLGLRMGDRRYALDALLSQDPPGTLRWLEAEACTWATRHRRWRDATGPTAEFWEGRASATAQLIGALAASAE
jgi:hypothetical protein